jgi:uncharacterized protein
MIVKSMGIMIALYLGQLGVALSQDRAAPAAPTVSVVGQAEAEARPDIATIILNVTDDRPTANDASNENTRITTAVVDGLKGSGIDAKDITTVGLSLFPIMSDQRDPKTNQPVRPVVNGFRASNRLKVRVRDIDRTGAFVAASVQNGALYQGVSFDLSDREAREDALRVQAVANAEHRASLYAQGASMKLGPLRSLGSEPGQHPAPYAAYGRAMSAAPGAPAPVVIEPGLITLSETINATWELAAP